MSQLQSVQSRRTFAIISHPDAGKTTLTEKLLLSGGAIQMAGAIKGKKASRHAASDWMALEQQKGISVTASVMQFVYRGCMVNLLDTPGHEDFSEDTYRTLTAVDSALMVIDCAKGVETRTEKLMQVCRLRNTPIMTFINKLDREGRDPLELLDEVEKQLGIECAPMTWPIGMGKGFRGIYHLAQDRCYLYPEGLDNSQRKQALIIEGRNPDDLRSYVGGALLDSFNEAMELVAVAAPSFDQAEYLAGRQTPVYFGSALNLFGVSEMMHDFVDMAPPPRRQSAKPRDVEASETPFSGFVFKIQANMDPAHRDRIAFLRICSGVWRPGIKAFHVRLKRDLKIPSAMTFMAADREHADQAVAGDIIGIYNHGSLRIGDTLTQGEALQYQGIPDFAPELFRRVQINDPMKRKALNKGLEQLCEEGATQLFKPMLSNELIVGAVGILQFEVVAHRLQHEYRVQCQFEAVNVHTARWVSCDDAKLLEQFINKNQNNLAYDHQNDLVYIAPTNVNLTLTQERWPDITFSSTKEHGDIL